MGRIDRIFLCCLYTYIIKQTCVERYGVDNPAKSKLIFDKIRNTNLIRYGSELPLQNRIICDKAFKHGVGRSKVRYYNDELWYQGDNEYNFLKSISDIKTVKRGPTIYYKFCNKVKPYFSDFIIDNIVYEIKSSWTWDNKGKNKLKLRKTKQAGYDIILVLNGKHYTYSELLKLR